MTNAVIGALRVNLGLNSAQFTNGLSQAQRQLNTFGGRMQQLGGRIAGIGAGLSAGVTAPLALFGTQAARAAIEAEELQSAFDYTFGEMADDMNAWARTTGDAMGRSTQALQQAAFGFGTLFREAAPTGEQAAELSQQFAELAQDLSSFFNVSESDALQKLRSGLSGEAEPLRAFGVFLNAAAVDARAMEMGLADASGAISEQAKILARANLIYEATASAHGDVERTSQSASNQIRTMQAAWQEMSVTLGSKILPALTPLVGALGRALEFFGNLPAPMQTSIVAFGALAAAMGPAMLAFGGLLSAAGALLPVLAPIAAPLLAAAAAAAALGAALYVFRDDIGPALQAFGESVRENIGPKIAPLFEALKAAAMALGDVFGAIFGTAGGGEGLRLALTGFGEIVSRVFAAAIQIITNAANVITHLLGAVAALLRGDFSGAWDHIRQLIGSVLNGIVAVFETLFPNIMASLRNLVEGVQEWLVEKLGAVIDFVIGKVRAIGDAFFNLWERVVGHSYVPDLIDGIAQEFGRLDQVMVNPALAANDNVAASFESMADRAASAVGGLIGSIERGDLKGVIGGVANILSGSGGTLGKIAKGVSGFLGGLPGFAAGGSFTVGGVGGIDSNLVAFRATRGEQVTVTPAGQAFGGGGLSVGAIHVNAGGLTAAEARMMIRQGLEGVAEELLEFQARQMRAAG